MAGAPAGCGGGTSTYWNGNAVSAPLGTVAVAEAVVAAGDGAAGAGDAGAFAAGGRVHAVRASATTATAKRRMQRASSPAGANPSGMTASWVRQALDAKRDGAALPAATWERLIDGYVDGTIDEAPIAALLMAVAIRGLTGAETHALTAAMIRSGDTIAFDGPAVDKHSTGGVGDSVSLIVVPLVAACGVPVAKLSGRALGFTGGTLDKLEAIPGVRTDLTPAAFRAQVERIGCAIAAQSERLVPADKRLYALRDRTGTVPSVGLIASSIVSKKIAGGASAIVFDVKAGRGAFMATLAQARELARALVALCAAFGRRASARITGMDEPLGPAIGPALEVIEAREFLAGRTRDPRLAEVVRVVAAEMLHVGGAPAGAGERIEIALAGGTAYERFVALIEAQGGTRAAFEALRVPQQRALVRAQQDGYIGAVDAAALGEAARAAGEHHGPLAGILVHARIGDTVRAGDVLAELAGAGDDPGALAAAFTLADHPVERAPLVCDAIRDADLAVPSNAGPG
jgi:pyrimidine-nucleoside phosphorylase